MVILDILVFLGLKKNVGTKIRSIGEKNGYGDILFIRLTNAIKFNTKSKDMSLGVVSHGTTTQMVIHNYRSFIDNNRLFDVKDITISVNWINTFKLITNRRWNMCYDIYGVITNNDNVDYDVLELLYTRNNFVKDDNIVEIIKIIGLYIKDKN